MNQSYTFDRPYRALGVRSFNAAARLLEKCGLRMVDFREEAMLARARRWTGYDDFGDESFRAPLRVLLKAYEEDSALHPLGRVLTWVSTMNLLTNRLRVEHEIRLHPEILDAPIVRPLFVAGLPRTGTTLLYNLLAQDPAARPLMFWEAISPAERERHKGRQPDPRIARARWVMKGLGRLAPHLAAVHAVEADGPEECSRLQMATFLTAYATMESYVPSYRRWLAEQPREVWEQAYRDYRRQLQVLQWQRPPRSHWVLKSPAHIWGLGPLMHVFPDACVVQTHRDPQKVIASLCSLYSIYQGIGSDCVRSRELGAEIVEICAEGLRRSYAARQAAGPARVVDLHYPHLMADPIGSLREIYDHFGYEFSSDLETRARDWHTNHPQHKHGKHRYELAQFGLDRATIDRAFAPYCRDYGIEPEAPRQTPPAVGAAAGESSCRAVSSQS